MVSTGLREHARDSALLVRAGDAELMPPTAEELVRLAAQFLLPLQDADGCPRQPVAAQLTYLRWKPGTSTTAVYALRCEDGSQTMVIAKRYLDGKAEWLRQRSDKRVLEVAANGWRARAVLEDQGLVLRVFPADRELLGHQTLLDPKRLARVVQEAGLVAPRSIRRRRTHTRLLRYKPERRSVWRVELHLRGDEPGPLVLAARVLPLAHAARVWDMRRPGGTIDRSGVGPRLHAHLGHTGLLLEEWLELEPGAQVCARETGAITARLHTAAPVHKEGCALGVDRLGLSKLFASEPGLWSDAERIPVPNSRSDAWVHGDLHPDQVVVSRAGARLHLLDLDNAGPGDRTRELAGWVLDQLLAEPEQSLDQAARELLTGYAQGGGIAPSPGHLAEQVADLCVHAAGACFRRLEEDAAGKAAGLLGLARRCLGGVSR